MGGVFRPCVAVCALALTSSIDNHVLDAMPADSVSLPELRRLLKLTSTVVTIPEIDLTDVTRCFNRLVIIFCSVALYHIMQKGPMIVHPGASMMDVSLSHQVCF